MKFLKQIFIIFGLCLAGIGISSILPFTFPSSLISMILLLILMITKVIKPDMIKETSELLLGIMAFLFVPAGVAIIEQYSFLKGKIFILIIICIITTIITFIVTAYTITAVMKIMNKGEKSDERISK